MAKQGSVQGAARLSPGCGMAQLRVWRGSAPDYTLRPFQFFLKLAEIFAAQGALPVSLTPVANGKNLQSEKFSLFLLDTFG